MDDSFDGLPLFEHLRARPSDPPTSHEAAESIPVTWQAWMVLRSYADGAALLDHDAYRWAGFASARQRCSDLREAGYIERTGERARTPSGRAGYLCRITPLGRWYLKRGMIDDLC